MNGWQAGCNILKKSGCIYRCSLYGYKAICTVELPTTKVVGFLCPYTPNNRKNEKKTGPFRAPLLT